MNSTVEFPFYGKLASVLLILTLLLATLYVGSEILMPIFLALLFAILLRPVVSFLNKKLKFPHVIAAMTSVILFILFIAGVIFFVSWQIGGIADDWSKIQSNLGLQYHNIQQWVKQSFHISYTQQNKYIQQATRDSLNGSNLLTGSTIDSFTNTLLDLVLIPFLIFLFLLYRNLFLKFLSRLFKKDHEKTLQEVLFNVKIVVQSFLVGLLIEMGVVAALTSIGLMIAGIQYAVLLGTITGILNLIPYIGILVAGLLTIVATLGSSSDISIILSVVGINIIVQLIDNNILVPVIVNSKVKINALVSIIGIIIGGKLAGIAGMFLAIPVIAILKVIFDRIESFKPWGLLLGDDLPKTYEWGKITLPSFDVGDSADLTDEKKSYSENNPNN